MIKGRHILKQKELEEDFSVNGVSIFRSFPEEFSAFELTFFESISYLFFPKAKNRDRVNYLCKQARLLYFATKMHILTMLYEHNSIEDRLEMTVLCGDLLSSRFALRLIQEDEFEILNRWLSYQLSIVEELTKQARHNTDVETRSFSQIKSLFKRLLDYSETDSELFGPANPLVREHLDSFIKGFITSDWDDFRTAVAADEQTETAFEQYVLKADADREISLEVFLNDVFNDAHWVKA